MIIEKQTHAEFRMGLNADVDTAAEKLTDDASVVYMYVRVQASSANAGIIYVGHNAGVSASNGWALAAGESIDIPVNDASKVWVIASQVDQAVKWLAV